MRWDLFCRVIDNHGDLGVCWRLAVDLAQRGHRVRLWVDDASALRWMAPQGHPLVQVLPWSEDPLAGLNPVPGDVVVEAFGCELPARYQQVLAQAEGASCAKASFQRVWVNLEYLSAEPYVERLHGLPSPILQGPAQGLTKWFFYPGFSPKTGGLIRESHLAARQERSKLSHRERHQSAALRISLFCYEPASLGPWLNDLSSGPGKTCLWATAGRATAAVQHHLGPPPDATPQRARHGQLSVSYLPYLSQSGFDRLLASCDLNCVRGEDSLVRAIWAGRPFLWQLYPQDDQAHLHKLEAFLQVSQAPASLAKAHRAWNADQSAPLPALTPDVLSEWLDWAQRLRERLCQQADLTTRLLNFVADKRQKR